MEAANRTKLKKAMASYEKALNQMIIDNDIKGSVATEFPSGTCTETTKYFKKIKETNACIFQTADRVWWDITDITHPLISLKDEITAGNKATLAGNADSIEDDKTSFIMVGDNKNGIVRINDNADSSLSATEKNYLSKLYGFMNNNVTEDCDIVCQYKRGDTIGDCEDELKSCKVKTNFYSSDDQFVQYAIYDDNGDKVMTYAMDYYSNPPQLLFEEIFNADGTAINIGYGNDGSINFKGYYDTHDTSINAPIQEDWGTDSQGNSCLHSRYNSITNELYSTDDPDCQMRGGH